MFRLTIKNLAANRIRLALTTFAVVLAVAFVVSSFVLTDGLRSSFDDLAGDIATGTDFELRPDDSDTAPDVVAESVLTEVEAIEGVEAAGGLVEAENLIRPINGEGEKITLNGPPQLSFGWVDDERLSSVTLTEGRAPTADGEFTMDLDAAANHGFDLGGTYRVIVPDGTTEATLVGLTRFGEDNATLGATIMHFDSDALQTLIGQDGFESISVALAPGADRDAVESALSTLVPGTEVVDQATLESEAKADFGDGIDILGNVLLGFAGVSLFVSLFIIYNTFSIVLGQRTRELALLRTVGADPRQLRRSVQAEALVIGVVASALGILGGIGLTYGLRGLFGLIGADLPDSPIIVSTRTVLVAAAVGIGMTLLSSIGPARKASRVPPVAALRDGATAGSVSGRMRMLLGTVLALTGAAAGAVGLFAAEGTTSIIVLLAVGAIGVIVGVAMLSPLVAEPVTRAMGWPLHKVLGTSGRLAQQNAGRNPQRTATTASALMIGLAVVSMTLTVGESVKAQLRSTLDSSVQADYLAVGEDDGYFTFPTETADRFIELEETATVTTFHYDRAEVDGVEQSILGTDFATTEILFDLDPADGVVVDPSVADPVLISDEEAAAKGLEVGDTVPVVFDSGQARDLTVIGIIRDDVITGEPYVFDLSTWGDVGNDADVTWLGVGLADGVSREAADAAFAPIVADYPQISLTTTNEYVEDIEGQIDQALATVNVMVVLAVVIALIGIANTLALSVFERTRELGLLRAVGMSRRQTRRMIRLEAALVALFGAGLGVAVGVLFGWAAVLALPATVTDTLAIPATRILLLVAVAGAAGLVAAWGPARRAGRLNVLEAIAT